MLSSGTLRRICCKYREDDGRRHEVRQRSGQEGSYTYTHFSEWWSKEVIQHSPDAVKAVQYMADFFVSECKYPQRFSGVLTLVQR
jgi:hypothetical protein